MAGQITANNYNDIKALNVQPPSPVVDQLWLDTSVIPFSLKVWANGDTWDDNAVWDDNKTRWDSTGWWPVNDTQINEENLIANSRCATFNKWLLTDPQHTSQYMENGISKGFCYNGAGVGAYIQTIENTNIKSNTQYTLTYCQKNALASNIRVDLYHNKGSLPLVDYDKNIYSDFTKKTITFTTPADASNFVLRFYYYSTGNETCVKDIKLALGSKVREWSPTQEEVDSTITKFYAETMALSGMATKATAQFTIIDQNDICIASTPPSNPNESPIWLDTSVVPNLLKKWDGSVWGIVNDIKLGGRNLFLDSATFKNYTFGSDHGNPNGTYVTDISGDYMDLTLVNTGDVYWYPIMKANREKGKTYTISLEIKTTSTFTGYWYPSENYGIDKIKFPNTNGIWQRWSFTYTQTGIAVNNDTCLFGFNGLAGQNIKFRKIKLEVSNKDSDWSVAPEDIDSSIAKAKEIADTAMSKLEDTVNDNKLTADEKQALKRDFDSIVSEKVSLDNQADLYAITTEKVNYDMSYNALYGYTNPLLSNLTTTEPVIGEKLRGYFADYYSKKAILLEKIIKCGKNQVDNILPDNNLTLKFTNIVGCSVTGNTVTKTTGAGIWGDSGFSATQKFTAGQYVEATATQDAPRWMLGLSTTDTNQNFTSIQYAWYPDTGGTYYIFENGVNAKTFSGYSIGDVFRIAIEYDTFSSKNVVNYYKNGALMHTSVNTPTLPMVLDTALILNNVSMGNITKGTIVSGLINRLTRAESSIVELDKSITSKVTQVEITNSINQAKQIPDTRGVNQPPKWYWTNYPKQAITEFKSRSTIGVIGTCDFGSLTTTVQWGDVSGGPITQEFKCSDGTFRRSSKDADTWNAWEQAESTQGSQIKADAAKAVADTAQANAKTANDLLADIASDNKLTASEKQSAKKEWDIIVGEKPQLDAQADTFGITTEKTEYDNLYTALDTYLKPLLADLVVTTGTDFTGDTFRKNFKNYYDKRTALLKAVSDKQKVYTDSKVDGIQVGGRNLILNSGFENGSDKWVNHAGDAKWSIDANMGLSSKCLHLTPSNANSGLYVSFQTVLNQKYTLSCWAKTIKSGETYFGFVSIGGRLQVGYGAINTWYHHEITFVGNGANLPLYAITIGDSTVEVLIDNIKLELGTKATDWIPAPEDTQVQIDDVITKVKSTETSIKQLNTDIEFKASKTEMNSGIGKNKWLVKRYNILIPNGTPISYDTIKSNFPVQTVEAPDTTCLQGPAMFGADYSNYVGVASTFIYLTADYILTTTLNTDDQGCMYLNEVKVIDTITGITTNCAIPFKKGWNRIEIMWAEQAGGDGFTLGTALSSNSNVQLMSCYYNIDSISEGRIKIAEDNIDLRVNKDGVIAAINASVNSGESKITISADRINMKGAVNFESFNPDMKSIFTNGEKGTLIDGAKIKTGSITSDQIDTSNFKVIDQVTKIVGFSVSSSGEVNIKGNLSSYNYDSKANTGWCITKDGIAVLNQATIRGDIILPNAGMTNNTENNIRIWAGSNFESRANAPFIVYQDGTVQAKKGVFEGTFSGEVNIGNIHLKDSSTSKASIKVNDNAETRTLIDLNEENSYIDVPFAFGNNDAKYVSIDNTKNNVCINNNNLIITQFSHNLLLNAGFVINCADGDATDATDHWTLGDSVQCSGDFIFDGFTIKNVQSGLTGNNWRGMQQIVTVPITKGEIFTGSIMTYSDSALTSIDGGAMLQLYFLNASGARIAGAECSVSCKPTASLEWQRFVLNTPPAPADAVKIEYNTWLLTNGRIWYCHPTLERGTKYTTWAVHKNDVKNVYFPNSSDSPFIEFNNGKYNFDSIGDSFYFRSCGNVTKNDFIFSRLSGGPVNVLVSGELEVTKGVRIGSLMIVSSTNGGSGLDFKFC